MCFGVVQRVSCASLCSTFLRERVGTKNLEHSIFQINCGCGITDVIYIYLRIFKVAHCGTMAANYSGSLHLKGTQVNGRTNERFKDFNLGVHLNFDPDICASRSVFYL